MSQISSRFILDEQKQRAAPSSTKFSKISPIGSNKFNAGETIRFRFPTRQGAWFDPSQSFISYTVLSTATTGPMAVSGCGGFVRTSLLRAAGQHVSSIENYPVYRNLYTKIHTPLKYLDHDGEVMEGTNSFLNGVALVANTPRSFVDFLPNFAGLFAIDKMLPLSVNSSLEWDITLGGVADNFTYAADSSGTAHALLSSNLQFSECTLHLCITELPMDVEKSIVSMHNGIYKTIVSNTQYMPFSITNTMSAVLQLGLSMSSLTKIDVCFTDATPISTIPFNVFLNKDCISARLLIDGVPFIPHGIECKSDAINLAMARAANHSASDTSITMATDLATYRTNHYFISFDTESIARNGNLRSGLNVSSSTVVLELNFGSAQSCNVHCLCSYDALVSVDKNSSNDYEISI